MAGDDMPEELAPKPRPGGKSEAEIRRERLAKELRDNLKKRKEQKRERQDRDG